MKEGLDAASLAEETKDPNAAETFAARQKIMAPLFKGMQVVARKSLTDDKVELKMRLDVDPIPNSRRPMPEFMLQPMVKIGDQWKLGGSTREYRATWDSAGQIQTFVQ